MNQEPADEWQGLDSAARANLSDEALGRFFRYRDDLRARGEPWDEAEIILTGWIWDETELQDSEESET